MQKCKIKAEIVKENIPLLLSKSSLKKTQTVIDLDNDKDIIFGKEINLHQSTSSYYCIDISPLRSCSNIEQILYLGKDLSSGQCKTQATKTHKQFGHGSNENMNKLIKNDGLFDTQTGELLLMLYSNAKIVNDLENLLPTLL